MVESASQPEEEGLEIDTINLRDEEKEARGEPLEGLKNIIFEESQPERVIHISNQLDPQGKAELS